MTIGLLLISTGKYHQFVQPLLDSARKYFMANHQVTYFLFTDSDKWKDEGDVVTIFKKHEPFPGPTLKRYETFYTNRALFDKADYLFYCDVDMLFVAGIGDEILSDRTATLHPGFLGGRGTPEIRKESLACVHPNEDMVYFTGAFNGGAKKEFIKMSELLAENIQKDLDNRIIAIWHDESHLNRYLIDHPPSKILPASYCYPEKWDLPFEKKIIALDKDHAEIRR
jgi:histo-blood group ABO system transferase